MDAYNTPCKTPTLGADWSWKVKDESKVYQQKRLEGIANLPGLPQTAVAKISWLQHLVGLFQKIDMSPQDYMTKWVLLAEDWIGDPG